jgi:5-methyltetrahydropteroyltriglutamate--homocysteine methyltransferase
MELPILPTSMLGSYSMPGWLDRLKTEYFARRMSRRDLDAIYDTAVKATIKDEEVAGLDIITDGEARRDNMVDYFIERMNGVHIDRTSKKFYYDFYDTEVLAKLPLTSLGLVQDFKFFRGFTDRAAKICITGPHCLTKRIRNHFYASDEALAMDIAKVMNLELKALAAAGADVIQIDEPYFSGFPEDVPWAVRVINELVAGVNTRLALHICYGNRYGKPSWEGSYRYLFPAILDAKVNQLNLEFARRGDEDLKLFTEFQPKFNLGFGVIDVKTQDLETPEQVADQIRVALNVLPAERLTIMPDCGCFHLPRDVAFAKIHAMVEGTRIVRRELGK